MPQQVVRLIIAFAIFVGIFFIARMFLVPATFGEFGHYRGNSLREIAALPVKYVDKKTCTGCHMHNANLLASDDHKNINCQICHGPGYKHNSYFEQNRDKFMVRDSLPDTWKVDSTRLTASIAVPDEFHMTRSQEREFCLKCHLLNAARKEKTVKQIDINDHYDINKRCVKCHPPHAPNS